MRKRFGTLADSMERLNPGTSVLAKAEKIKLFLILANKKVCCFVLYLFLT
jgi:hypothetical protein